MADLAECSFWQFRALAEGWRKVNTSDEKLAAPTDDEHDALVAKYG